MTQLSIKISRKKVARAKPLSAHLLRI